jgi:hypothetical protein
MRRIGRAIMGIMTNMVTSYAKGSGWLKIHKIKNSIKSEGNKKEKFTSF